MIRFVTGNEGKVREAREYLPEEVQQVDYDYAEVQSADLETIVRRGARETYEALGEDEPVLVDDSGLFVESLDGFPGPYSAYVEDTLGIERVWDLVAEEDNRRAAFRTVLAYCDGEGVESEARRASEKTSGQGPRVKTFEGSVRGRIVELRGEGGFGYDPIFEHDGQTFAEMSTEEKNAVSHRGRALAAFADWLSVQE
jgi:XTP/dITP diphosphohydrolase